MLYRFSMVFYFYVLGALLSNCAERPASDSGATGSRDSSKPVTGHIPFSKLEPAIRKSLATSELEIGDTGNLTITDPALDLQGISWSEDNRNYLSIDTLVTMDVTENNINDALGTIIPLDIKVPASIRYKMDFNFEINSWEMSYDRKAGEWEPGDALTSTLLTLMSVFGPLISSSNLDQTIEEAFETSVSRIVQGLPADALEFVQEMDPNSSRKLSFSALLINLKMPWILAVSLTPKRTH